MRGQLYCRHANATTLSSSPVVSALGSESDDPGSSPGCALETCGEKMQAPLLGLAKSVYYEFLTNLNGPYKIHLVAIRELFN